MTVDQLAARAGLTVRNVRAYAARGLLPPPRLVGRTGWYGPQHLARLEAVRAMLGDGYSLAAVERILAQAPASSGVETLALQRTLIAPWLPDEPQETTIAALGELFGVEEDPALQVELAEMGLLEPLDGERVRILDPALLAAGLEVVRMGIPVHALVAAQKQVIDLVEQIAQIYVQMFLDTSWRDFVADGAPADGWSQVQSLMERLPAGAAAALLASFRTAMAAEVEQAVETALQQAPRPD